MRAEANVRCPKCGDGARCRCVADTPPTPPAAGATGAPREHELRCWPEFFAAILDGSKPFEVRRDDRGFRVGDVLRLREYEPYVTGYTGRELRVRVTYRLDREPWLPGGYVALGIDTPDRTRLAAELAAAREALRSIADDRPAEGLHAGGETYYSVLARVQKRARAALALARIDALLGVADA